MQSLREGAEVHETVAKFPDYSQNNFALQHTRHVTVTLPKLYNDSVRMEFSRLHKDYACTPVLPRKRDFEILMRTQQNIYIYLQKQH